MRTDSNEGVLWRIRSEYTEMPGLQLTSVQAERLWGLERDACDAVLASLVESGFLRRGVDGRYRRTSYDPIRTVPGRSVKADLPRSPHSQRHDAA